MALWFLVGKLQGTIKRCFLSHPDP